MVDPVLLSASRAYPVTVEQAFDGVLPAPLEQLFHRRYGPIPRIRSTEGQRGTWSEVGQTRTVRLADGGSMLEELTSVDRPNAFSYALTNLTGPLKPIASHIEGRWSFTPVGTGSRITWQWTLHPVSAMTARALPIFSRFWRGYAAQALQHIEDLLLAHR
jgi:polyketide cyclase/dehydrase/lipid transport protein